jgi:acyl-CoA thioester hydrolase
MDTQAINGRPTESVTQLAAHPVRTRHVYHRQVRFSDIDANGHVNNVRFLEYLEDARIALYQGYEGAPPEERSGLPAVWFAIVRHEVDYRRPLGFRHGWVRVESWMTKVNWASCQLAARIRSDDEVFAEAHSTIAGFDPNTGRVRRFTAPERAFLRSYLL